MCLREVLAAGAPANGYLVTHIWRVKVRIHDATYARKTKIAIRCAH